MNSNIIDLDLYNDLTTRVITSPGRFDLTIRSDINSHLQIKNNGLYVEAIPGEDDHGGSGYDDYYTSEGVRLGYSTLMSESVRTPRVVTCTNYIHRLFESEDEQGQRLINFRPEVDYVLAGDFFRVQQSSGHYKYFLVVSTESVENGTTRITDSALLGEW